MTEVGPCSRDGGAAAGEPLRCEVASGVLTVAATAPWSVTFEPSTSGVLTRIGFSGPASVPGALGFLSDGFQSWSMSGAVALRDALPVEVTDEAFAQRGDPEVLRSGEAFSWWWSVVGGDGPALVAGVTSASNWKSWVMVDGKDATALTLTLASGAGESVSFGNGAAVAGEPWFIGAESEDAPLLEVYGAMLPSRRTPPLVGEAGWNSWYDLWDDVDADAVLQNAALARAAFAAAGLPATTPLRIVVDDCWQEGWGRWSANTKFAGGLGALVKTLHDDGFEAGVWLAPLLVDEDDAVVAAHPEWFLPGLSYGHALHGPMRVLDVTHPDAAAHLAGAIDALVLAGLDFLKIDFLFAGTWEAERHQPMTGMAAYRKALAVIRDAAGPTVTLLAVGAPPVAGFDLIDAWRLGPDIALEPFGPGWAFIAPQLRSLSARWHVCRAVACDADPPILRQLPQNEVDVGAWVAALAGGAFFLSDDLRALPSDRHGWAFSPERLEVGLAGVAAVPESVFPEVVPGRLSNAFEDAIAGTSTARVPAVWRSGFGYRVAFNFGDESATIDGTDLPRRSTLVLP